MDIKKLIEKMTLREKLLQLSQIMLSEHNIDEMKKLIEKDCYGSLILAAFSTTGNGDFNSLDLEVINEIQKIDEIEKEEEEATAEEIKQIEKKKKKRKEVDEEKIEAQIEAAKKMPKENKLLINKKVFINVIWAIIATVYLILINLISRQLFTI